MIPFQLRKLFLDAIIDSPLEHVLRNTYTRLSPAKKDKYDRQMMQLMRRVMHGHSNAIDVGCYRGEVLREMLKISPAGRHFAFEPIPKNFEYLSRNFKGASVFNIALSDYTGESNFQHVLDRPARSGFCRVEYPDKNQEVREIKVKVDCLDNVIPDAIRVDFLKVDVEGAELNVFRGARKLIKASQPTIVFEHGWKRAATYTATPEQIYDVLTNELGLGLSTIERWLAEQAPFRQEQFFQHVYEGLDFCFVAHPLRPDSPAESTAS